MSTPPLNRNEPNSRTLRSKKRGDDNAPVGVDAETVKEDLARYGSLIANAESVVDQNVNTPLTFSRFGFVNALLRVLFRRGN